MSGRKQKTEFAEGKFISDRSAGVLSEPNPLKAVRRVLRDKEREGVALSNANGHPVRVGFVPSWHTGQELAVCSRGARARRLQDVISRRG